MYVSKDAAMEHLDRPLHQIPSPEKYLEQVSSRELLDRMNRNLKFSYLRRKDAEGALRAVDRLLVFEPGLATERRDRGLLLLELQRPDKALQELRRYLHEHPEGEDFTAMDQLRAELEANN